MNVTMLGTGSALVTECYNTCFVLQENEEYFMVDGGGGSAILHQLKHAGIDWKEVRTIFVTHKHYRSHYGYHMDDPYDMPAYEAGRICWRSCDICT